jgi:hypothetical protein
VVADSDLEHCDESIPCGDRGSHLCDADWGVRFSSMDEARSACEAWVVGHVQIQGLESESTFTESSADEMDDKVVIHGQVDVDVPQDTRPMTYDYVCAVDDSGEIIEEGSGFSSGG